MDIYWTFESKLTNHSTSPALNWSLLTAETRSSRWPPSSNPPPAPSPYKANVRWKKKKRQWTSDLSLRQQGKLCSLGATRVHHPLCHSSPQCLTLPSHKTLVKTSCSHFYGCQMVGRPSCLWTCLPSLVKPVDLGHRKTAVYEKAWDKTHKHPASETIHCHLISQRALLQDEGRSCEPWLWAGEVQMQLLNLWAHFCLLYYYYFYYFLHTLCMRGLKFSQRSREKQNKRSRRRLGWSRTAVWPSILVQPWLYLKQTPWRSIHLSPTERNPEKKV